MLMWCVCVCVCVTDEPEGVVDEESVGVGFAVMKLKGGNFVGITPPVLSFVFTEVHRVKKIWTQKTEFITIALKNFELAETEKRGARHELFFHFPKFFTR